LKQSVVETLSSIEQYDQLGFAKVLLLKANQRLAELNSVKNSSSSSRSYASIKKAVDYDAMQEEDADMGFAFFE